ncbi:FkbM family methyltransferase [Bradyrhizobium guangdongense]|uniref:FkbM family methyltransferase n=1 Tax=Bradyrhizobium guangdongense TaxID=1325090 RepID=UPI00131A1CAC|nr:FkbM family methyltransferase [Bradyrhizobium guangdongense]
MPVVAGDDAVGPFRRTSRVYENARFLTRCLRYRFRTERLQLKTLAGLRLEGATVLDIGANKGIYSYWLARAVGPTGKVIAFEPQPEMAEYMRRRDLGPNVEIINVALSDQQGSASLSRKHVGDGSASLCRDIGDTLDVGLARLDDFGPFRELKFIKCDVEGHELSVFRGGERILRSARPILQFESTPDEIEPIQSFLKQLGYSGVMFGENGCLPVEDIKRVPHRKFGFGGHRDFLFRPI